MSQQREDSGLGASLLNAEQENEVDDDIEAAASDSDNSSDSEESVIAPYPDEFDEVDQDAVVDLLSLHGLKAAKSMNLMQLWDAKNITPQQKIKEFCIRKNTVPTELQALISSCISCPLIRPINEDHVKQLAGLFAKTGTMSKFYASPIIAYLYQNKFYILDGNHRLMAIKLYNETATNKIEVINIECSINKPMTQSDILWLSSAAEQQCKDTKLNLTRLDAMKAARHLIMDNVIQMPNKSVTDSKVADEDVKPFIHLTGCFDNFSPWFCKVGVFTNEHFDVIVSKFNFLKSDVNFWGVVLKYF
uniref:ParB/Sulfiredoxin domain-containing protein n=1 Tax=Panagrolaimus superbus TaxID=310955 RepID=A0A914YPY2_9BILA